MLRRGGGSCVSFRNRYNLQQTVPGVTDRVSTWSLNPTMDRKERPCMAQQQPPIYFEDIPLEQARTMGRGPQMDPELYHAFKEKNSISGQCCNTHHDSRGDKSDHHEKPPPPRGRRTQDTVNDQKSARGPAVLALHGRRPRTSEGNRSTSPSSPAQRPRPPWPTPALEVNLFSP